MNQVSPKKMPRVWMNVTTSVHWNRPPVGIVRVEQELFKALSELIGDRLVPCVLSNGKFVRHDPTWGSGFTETVSPTKGDEIYWPDPSYDFPASSTLDLVFSAPAAPVPPLTKMPRTAAPRPTADEIGFGDVILSVGLDWDWEQQRLDSILYDLKIQKGVTVITCCYDLIPILFPHYCVGDVAAKFKEYFTNLTWSSSAMLCISRRSEADYRSLAINLGMPQIPTRVMLLGNKLPEPGDEVSEQVKSLCSDRFILFVSTIERRKNHEVIYKAVHILAERGELDPDLKVVFVGMPGWGVGDLLKDIELDPLTKDHIVLLNHANDAELYALYEHCQFFVYPSLYEGWGLPVAEALAFGKFVIASDRGSIPEVGGELVEYVDPWNASAWAAAIRDHFESPKALQERSERIRREYHPVQWSETASTVLELIETVRGDQLKRISIEPGYQMQSETGVCLGPRIVSTGAAGIIAHGPYCPVPAGPLQVTLEIETIGEEGAEVLVQFAAGRGEVKLGKKCIRVSPAHRTKSFDVEVMIEEAIDDFEVVVSCAEGVLIGLNRIELRFS